MMTSQLHSAQIMVQLKESTREQHDAAEHGAFNEQLMKGRLPRESYVRSIEQFFLIHRALERRLRRLRGELPAFERVLREEQFQEPYLREDLQYFGIAIDAIAPLPATMRFIKHIETLAEQEPIALLGVHYVFEGSNNGSRFIARAVRRAYNLADTGGTRYLDPYGDRQTETWQTFKEAMNATPFTPEQTLAIVRAAGDTFMAVMALHRELYEQVEASAAVAASSMQKTTAAGKCPFHHAATK